MTVFCVKLILGLRMYGILHHYRSLLITFQSFYVPGVHVCKYVTRYVFHTGMKSAVVLYIVRCRSKDFCDFSSQLSLWKFPSTSCERRRCLIMARNCSNGRVLSATTFVIAEYYLDGWIKFRAVCQDFAIQTKISLTWDWLIWLRIPMIQLESHSKCGSFGKYALQEMSRIGGIVLQIMPNEPSALLQGILTKVRPLIHGLLYPLLLDWNSLDWL
jgi:hypothetical protein